MKLSELTINPDNPRGISKPAFEQLKGSIESFPKMMKYRPIIVDGKGLILGGNQRYKALLDLGFDEVPDNWVRNVNSLTEDEKDEFIIRDNVHAGGWDWQAIEKESSDRRKELASEGVPVWVDDELDPEGFKAPKKNKGNSGGGKKQEDMEAPEVASGRRLILEVREEDFVEAKKKMKMLEKQGISPVTVLKKVLSVYG